MNRVRRDPARVAVLLLLTATFAGCGAPEPPPETGARFRAVRAELVRALSSPQRLEGTRLARESRALEAALPDCGTVVGRAPDADFEALRESFACEAPGDDPHATDGWPISLRWPLESGLALEVRARVLDDDAVSVEARVPRAAADGVRSLLVPSREPTGPPLLGARDRLLHARFRPAGGIDIASFVAAGSQADQLFRLKSALFSGAVLDGTWESALYLPTERGAVTRAALALGFQQQALATAAMERFIEDLRKTWPVARTPFAIGSARGACLLDLNVLPGLAPCYVATDRAVVVGWNAASLEAALETGSAPGAKPLGVRGGVHVALDRFAEADARLAAEAHDGNDGAPPAPALPWRSLDIETEAVGSDVVVRARLEPAEDA
jgi:hypothetical protein